MTPLREHRRAGPDDLARFLAQKYPAGYAKAVREYDDFQRRGYFYAGAAWAGSWTASWFSNYYDASIKWYRLIALTKGHTEADRERLRQLGLRDNEIDDLILNAGIPRPTLKNNGLSDDEIDELMQSSTHSLGKGFNTVSIPNASAKPLPFRPPLKRTMSTLALNKRLPPAVTGDRRFFRTWVRAIKK
jgi:hypothetical protein